MQQGRPQITDCGGVSCAGATGRPRGIRRRQSRTRSKKQAAESVGGHEAAGAERSMIFLTTRARLRAHYHDGHAACMPLAARCQTPDARQGWATWTWGPWMGRRDGAWVHACVARVGEGEKVSATLSPPVSARRLPSRASTETTPSTAFSKPSRAGEKPSSDGRVRLVQSAPAQHSRGVMRSQRDLTSSCPAAPFTRPQLCRATAAVSGRRGTANTCPHPISARPAEPA